MSYESGGSQRRLGPRNSLFVNFRSHFSLLLTKFLALIKHRRKLRSQENLPCGTNNADRVFDPVILSAAVFWESPDKDR
ncbi:uncharacterized protein PHALS_04116 [Plasmopara halstedii]|uniref:Uncharacterized protein n=1 Tax=Plasmopara halstedii TaxID=4781 RepID=A0A0P1A9H1_PLAHL|nr:uncharacterized protein PHALS_04116 [Plasmopara halstedii]CEG36863.1 hypothetical protein PHALS_04116 [Plasmopara halstedii]|eukprot:XP_024573232.1 hypothetical protein PHALS_04116 [Plasmopara halstedii]